MSVVPTGLWTNCWFAHPTLKHGTDEHCAYGAGDGMLPAWSASAQTLLRGADHKSSSNAGGFILNWRRAARKLLSPDRRSRTSKHRGSFTYLHREHDHVAGLRRAFDQRIEREIACFHHIFPGFHSGKFRTRAQDNRIFRRCVDAELAGRWLVVHIVKTMPQASARDQVRLVQPFATMIKNPHGQMAQRPFFCHAVAACV